VGRPFVGTLAPPSPTSAAVCYPLKVHDEPCRHKMRPAPVKHKDIKCTCCLHDLPCISAAQRHQMHHHPHHLPRIGAAQRQRKHQLPAQLALRQCSAETPNAPSPAPLALRRCSAETTNAPSPAPLALRRCSAETTKAPATRTTCLCRPRGLEAAPHVTPCPLLR